MKSVIIFVLVCLYASFPKMIYSLFILLMLFLPKEKFETKKKCYIFRTFICFIFLLCVSSFLLPTVTSSDIAGDPRGGATSVSGQLELMIKNTICKDDILKELNYFIPIFLYLMFIYSKVCVCRERQRQREREIDLGLASQFQFNKLFF